MENNNDFLKDWLEGKVSPEELKARKEKGDPQVRDFDELITRSSRLKVPESLTKDDAWTKLSAKLNEVPKQEGKIVKLNRWIPLSIAASVSLIVVAFFVLNKTTITTPVAETKVYILPDGSEVTLNADSKIAFSRLGWSRDRKISLEGEAFFNVTKGSTFAVETEQGTVTVLGTSFNVNARVSRFEVSCFTGKVKVVSGTNDVTLTKGLFTELKGTRLIEAEEFDDQRNTWRNGDFHFESEPLRNVMDEMERQFGIEIAFDGDGSRLYTGYFGNQNLEEALEMVFKPMGLSYSRETNNKIIVK